MKWKPAAWLLVGLVVSSGANEPLVYRRRVAVTEQRAKEPA